MHLRTLLFLSSLLWSLLTSASGLPENRSWTNGHSYEVQASHQIQSVTQVTGPPTQFGKTEFDIRIAGPFTNPFDAHDIRLDMQLVSPSGKNRTLPCFFVSGNESSSLWKARFTPQEAGSYSYEFKLSHQNVEVVVSTSAQFTSAATARNGFLHRKDNWAFAYDSGKPFRGTSFTIGWEGRSWENKNYTYDYFLPKLAGNGINFFRTWMSAWNLPLEWKRVVDTDRYSNTTAYFHPGGIQRMDQLVQMADSLGMHMMLALDWHGGLQTGDKWNLNAYNVANGGPAATPSDFFTSEAARAQYKNRLRYLVARWGYSPSIGAWEFFNEIDNAAYNGTEITISIPHSAITNWHSEMATYLKSIDPYGHLVTTSISHREITGLFAVNDLDFNQKHIYKNTGSIPPDIRNNVSNHGKPYVVGEFGYDWDWNNVTPARGPQFDYDLKRGLWYGLFSPTPILPMTWWWEFFDERGMIPYFKGVREISSRMLLAGKGEFASLPSNAGGWESYAVKCGNPYFAYVLNPGTNKERKTLTLNMAENRAFNVQRFHPGTHTYVSLGTFTSAANALTIPDLELNAQSELVLIIIPEGNTEGVRLPFTGNALPLPGKVEAEDFDKGGEGVAYHDLDAANTGGQYRTDEGVDMGAADGGYALTATVEGEWLTYSVDVQKAGTYTLRARVSAAEAGKRFRVELDGQAISGPIAIPNTGGAQNWQTVSVPTAVLSAGPQSLRLVMDASEIGLNYLEFVLLNQAPLVALTAPENEATVELPATVTLSATASDPDGRIAKVAFYDGNNKLGEDTSFPYTLTWTPTAGVYQLSARATDNQGLVSTSAMVSFTVKPSQTQVPYAGAPYPVPGKIEAENFDQGAEGVAYHDLSPTNTFGQYRPNDAVDMEVCTDEGGGFSLGDNQTGEWVEYTVAVAQSAHYDFSFRVATQMSGQFFHIEMDGQNISGRIDVPNTGGWQSWQNVAKNRIALQAGSQVLRIVFDSEYFNLNHFTIEPAANQPPTISLSAPLPNATFAPGSNLTLTATAADADGTVALVAFFANGEKLGEATTAPYAFTWNNVALGTYALKARATDNQDATTETAEMPIQVAPVLSAEPSRPEQSLLAPNPAAGAFYLQLHREAQSIRVVDARGRLVYEQNHLTASSVHFGDGLAPGLYTVIIQLRSGQKEIRRGLKQ
jgi:hypothetical protein